jgi:two pore calcium channel protein 3
VWALAFTSCIFLLLLLFEKPNGSLDTELPFAATFTIELLCFAHFAHRLWEYRQITPRQQFWQEGKVVVVVVCMVLTLVDNAVFIILDRDPDNSYTRISRMLRPLFVINLTPSRLIRQGFRSVRRTIVKVVDVLSLLFITIGVFTILFVKLYGSRHDILDADGSLYMKRYDDTWWQLYVLVTTANFPDIMMPAYVSFS